MAQTTFLVQGMTCGHCQRAVSLEVSQVPGVDTVSVDLASGRVTVVGVGYTDEQIGAAIEQAGYTLAAGR